MKKVIIKRYLNRKLYNTDANRFVTLVDIISLIKEGVEVSVMDNQTNEDITEYALKKALYFVPMDLGLLNNLIKGQQIPMS